MNQIELDLNDLLKQKALELKIQSRTLNEIKHPTLKGSFREMILGNLIKPLLPATCGIYHGTVISSFSNAFRKKTEDDLLIVDRECLPPILYSERDGIFPIESVLAKIEVKSTLNHKNLKDAINGCLEFKKLKMNLKKYQDMDESNWPDNDTLQVIFAFASKIPNCYNYLKKVLNGMNAVEKPPLDCLCVVDKGMLSWGKRNVKESKRWLFCSPENGEHHEILAFLALLLETLPIIRQQRKDAMFGKYILCLKNENMKDAEVSSL